MLHCFDIRWKDDMTAVLQGISSDGNFQEIPLQKGSSFSLSIVDDSIFCVGSLKDGVYSPCPNKATGTKKCEVCKRADDYFPCQFCNGFNCHQFRDEKIENCDALHMVYLALFTKDLVKVGVSRMSRGKTRQVEQGSHFTRLFAENLSGVAARRLEKTLTEMGFPDKIPSSQKKDFLFPNVSLEEGKEILEKKAQEAADFLTSHAPEYKKYILPNSPSLDEFWDMRPLYADEFEALQNSPKPFHSLSFQQGESLGGTLQMIKGSFLLVETPDELVSFLGKDLVGKKISLENCSVGLTLNAGLQSSLF